LRYRNAETRSVRLGLVSLGAACLVLAACGGGDSDNGNSGEGKDSPATMIFWVNNGIAISDGSQEGTELLKGFGTGWELSKPMPANSDASESFVGVGENVFFAANDRAAGIELRKTDGTRDGTERVADINLGGGDSDPAHLTGLDGKIFFTADDGSTGRELWKSDGTGGVGNGTTQVADIDEIDGSNPQNLTVFNGELYFTAEDRFHGTELWKTDGTGGVGNGTIQVADINKINGSTQEVDLHKNRGSSPTSLTVFDGQLFFTAKDGSSGAELWKTDGTGGVGNGTTQVADINESGGSYPRKFTVFKGQLFFTADDGSTGRELWKSDGTGGVGNGTTQVTDINENDSSLQTKRFFPGGLKVFDGELFFSPDDKSSSFELWKTDGTGGVGNGTTQVADISKDEDSSSELFSKPISFTVFDGNLFFIADDGSGAYELWKTDGTGGVGNGATQVTEGEPGLGSRPSHLTVIGDELFFQAYDGVRDDELWKSDGTTSGTEQVKDIRTGDRGSSPSNITALP